MANICCRTDLYRYLPHPTHHSAECSQSAKQVCPWFDFLLPGPQCATLDNGYSYDAVVVIAIVGYHIRPPRKFRVRPIHTLSLLFLQANGGEMFLLVNCASTTIIIAEATFLNQNVAKRVRVERATYTTWHITGMSWMVAVACIYYFMVLVAQPLYLCRAFSNPNKSKRLSYLGCPSEQISNH